MLSMYSMMDNKSSRVNSLHDKEGSRFRKLDINIIEGKTCDTLGALRKEEADSKDIEGGILILDQGNQNFTTFFLTFFQGLYHQQCRNVCVLFAAIPNFKFFFSNIDVTGNECLRLLNEILSAFDQVSKIYPWLSVKCPELSAKSFSITCKIILG